MLRRVLQIAAAVAVIATAVPAAAFNLGNPRVQISSNLTPTIIARLVPNAAWTGAPGSSGGTAPITGAVTTDFGQQNTGGGDGITYGAQAILAVGTDAALNSVPQLTVTSTATMGEGEFWRVDGTGLLGVDQQSRIHIVDATHVDLCDNMNFAASGNGRCIINTADHQSPVTTGYSGSGGHIFFDQTAVGAVAEHPNVWCENGGCNITVGAASNTDGWIDHVDLCAEVCAPGSMVRVTQQTKNPQGNFFGWTVNLQSRGALDAGGPKDGIINLFAVITPVNGYQRVLGPLKVILNTAGTIQHPTFYVDGGTGGLGSDSSCDGRSAAPASSPVNGHCAWATLTQAMCSMYSAPGSSTSSGPIVHVAGSPITTSSNGYNPTAGRMYAEVPSAPCGGSNTPLSDYAARFIADAPVYLTTSSTPSAWGGTFTVWNLPLNKASFEGPFAFDTEFTTPVIGSTGNPRGNMLWFGAGTSLVAASGQANTYYGAQGPALMYYPGMSGAIAKSFDGITSSNFVGLGEASIDSTTAGPGPTMMRDVNISINIDCMQTDQGTFAFFNVTCNHKFENIGPTTASYVTVKDVICTTSYFGLTNQAPILQIDTNETPWPLGTAGYGPLYMFVLTGNGGNASNSTTAPNWHLGAYSTTETFMCIPNTKCVTQTAAAGATYIWLKPTMGCQVPAGGGNAVSTALTASGQPIVNLQAGDKLIIGGEQHPDFLQIGQNNENMYLQNYVGKGENQQAALFQETPNPPLVGPLNVTYMTTVGRNFTFSPVGNANVGNELYVPGGNQSAYHARRVVSLGTPVTATWIGGWGSNGSNDSTKLNLNVTSNVVGTLQLGMEIFVNSSNDCSGAFYDSGHALVSQTSGTTGGAGVYVMNSGPNQKTQGLCMKGVGYTNGVLDGPYPTDITTPASGVTISSELKDMSCVNCLFDDTVTLSGLQFQWQSAERHVFFRNWSVTSQAGDPFSNGNVYHTAFRAAYTGYRGEASGIVDAIMPLATYDTSGPVGSDLIGLRNVQYTDYNSYNYLADGATFAGGTTTFDPTSRLPSNTVSLLTRAAKSAINIPWDINGYPTAAGQPVGAVAH